MNRSETEQDLRLPKSWSFWTARNLESEKSGAIVFHVVTDEQLLFTYLLTALGQHYPLGIPVPSTQEVS